MAGEAVWSSEWEKGLRKTDGSVSLPTTPKSPSPPGTPTPPAVAAAAAAPPKMLAGAA